jgi:hypothetical protein
MVIPPEKLAALPLSERVLRALIRRPKLDPDLRIKALNHLAEEGSKGANIGRDYRAARTRRTSRS